MGGGRGFILFSFACYGSWHCLMISTGVHGWMEDTLKMILCGFCALEKKCISEVLSLCAACLMRDTQRGGGGDFVGFWVVSFRIRRFGLPHV